MDKNIYEISKNTSSGIYRIFNKVTRDFYIGSSKNILRRFYQHNSGIRRKNHFNKAINKHLQEQNPEDFEFEILEYCEPFELKEREGKYFEAYNPTYNRNNAYSSTNKTHHRISMEMKINLFEELQKICTKRKLSITSYITRSLISRLRLESIILDDSCVCVCKCKNHKQG
jgi:group I intron endonuclease